jgi:hypothetical protein
VGDYDFYISCGCCRRYSVLWNSLCVDTPTSSAATVTRVKNHLVTLIFCAILHLTL